MSPLLKTGVLYRVRDELIDEKQLHHEAQAIPYVNLITMVPDS